MGPGSDHLDVEVRLTGAAGTAIKIGWKNSGRGVRETGSHKAESFGGSLTVGRPSRVARGELGSVARERIGSTIKRPCRPRSFERFSSFPTRPRSSSIFRREARRVPRADAPFEEKGTDQMCVCVCVYISRTREIESRKINPQLRNIILYYVKCESVSSTVFHRGKRRIASP